MPYIKKEDRDRLHPRSVRPAETAGELNYQVTCLLIAYVKKRGLCYATANDIAGALTNASWEFYRRIVGPYEDQKINENGDVY